MKVELHCHTRLSDGSFTFEQILEQAVQEGVVQIAVTNHDTTRELELMMRQGLERGIAIIPGIEISGYDEERRRRVHILGYYIDPGSPEIEALCGPLLERRHQGCLQAIARLMEAGYAITLQDVMRYAEGGTGIYKQHIMHALIDRGYTKSIYGDLYKKLFARGQNGEQPGIAYIPTEYVDAREAVRVILQAGGVPVLAHPGQYGNFEFVPELVDAGLQGIEVWHPLHNEADEHRAREHAAAYGLIMTGGSDFHGFYGEREVLLGSKSPGLSVVEELRARRQVLHGDSIVTIKGDVTS
ncbi:PHP domain-containing protein [Paenibacillus sp. GCM10023248]|uniref:PHP domain-containing protein n=1 Tax=Bacillales TaxID=1385 RepID=UPI00237A08D2|nr:MULTISPECIES: PHP domain-containing protein [Bacillales]MDD9266747.1 PHP domain-containing protein [Paenibacillus sp. MAHUQ-63]MDR6883692.1 putative metal-dependent phosphoesterase TrpH [Bacillus sp. 3255]